jgi:hypothetical protein
MKLAMWLLWRFGVPQRNESLLGDLIEERAAGRSALWLWGQTAAAIADAVARDLRDHWVLALRAMGTGWFASFLFAFIWERVPPLEWWWRIPESILTALLFLALFAGIVIVWPLACGWIVAQTHRAQSAAMVLAYAASVALCAPWVRVQCQLIDPADRSLWLGCLNVLLVLSGGLLPGLRRRTR